MSTRYSFKSETFNDYDEPESIITHQIEGYDMTWSELLEEFTAFLRGCGYCLPEGELDFVDDFVDVDEQVQE